MPQKKLRYLEPRQNGWKLFLRNYQHEMNDQWTDPYYMYNFMLISNMDASTGQRLKQDCYEKKCFKYTNVFLWNNWISLGRSFDVLLEMYMLLWRSQRCSKMVLGNVIFFHVNQTKSLKRTEWESEAINRRTNNKIANRQMSKKTSSCMQNTTNESKNWAMPRYSNRGEFNCTEEVDRFCFTTATCRVTYSKHPFVSYIQ